MNFSLSVQEAKFLKYREVLKVESWSSKGLK